MRNFEILFDFAEASPIGHPAYSPYGNLGFPGPPPGRPWVYSNFVQSLDGIVSYRGHHATGADISHSPEDRWLMDLLRAHADAIILGLNTLVEETKAGPYRGHIYRVEDPVIQELRRKLKPAREKNIFVTGAARLNPSDFRVFDGEFVDPFILTTEEGAAGLWKQAPSAKVIVAGQGKQVDLPKAMSILRREWGIEHLLCEGGPTLYGYMSRAGLIDEKFLTISPVEVGLLIPPEQDPSETEKLAPPRERPTTFMAPGFTMETAPWWNWMSCRKIGDHQFNRYRRRRA